METQRTYPLAAPDAIGLFRDRERKVACPKCGAHESLVIKDTEAIRRNATHAGIHEIRVGLRCNGCDGEVEMALVDEGGTTTMHLRWTPPVTAEVPREDEPEPITGRSRSGLDYVVLENDEHGSVRCPTCARSDGVAIMEPYARTQHIGDVRLHSVSWTLYCYPCGAHSAIALDDHEGTSVVMQVTHQA